PEERLQKFSSHGLVQERTHAVESTDFNDCQNRQGEQRKCYEKPLDEVGQCHRKETTQNRVDDGDDAADNDTHGEADTKDDFEEDAKCHELGTDVYRLENCHDDNGNHTHHM